MELIFFYAAPLLIAGVAVAIAVTTVLRARERSQAWSSGLVAEARCLRIYTSTHRSDSGSRTVRHFVFEFTTAEGRTVRFEEEDLPGTIIEDDFVPVHYTADRPEKATAQEPSRTANILGTTGILVFCGVIVAFCVVFMVVATTISDAMGDF
ncbi:DUF3592 domain-containing protein [Streptomyces sp. NPDC059578]|uniref:DUF3592 domain-containing protein n=1 Tax=Streptomyces sp. NPDC059578 TaxID=3346874 RepID=UPI0036C012DA